MGPPMTGWAGQLAVSGVSDGHSSPRQALPNGAPASSKPSSPALIETKEPNGSAHNTGSSSEETEEPGAQVRARLRAQVPVRGGEAEVAVRGVLGWEQGAWPLA